MRIDDEPDVLISPVCCRCVRWSGRWHSCEAFPSPMHEIPKEIWQGRNAHLESVPGDGGKVFVLRTEGQSVVAPNGKDMETRIGELTGILSEGELKHLRDWGNNAV
jgi:hypothetical protein